ncbi:MAG: hypothetical protein ACH37Z_04190 [Anaerolineae bacterium]
MNRYESLQDQPPELGPAIRNNYFHGKLMDAYHFQMETDYHNAKRWLLNRMNLGWGVACGLNVLPVDGVKHSIRVTAGMAIDAWGREIIVPGDTNPIRIPRDVIAAASRGVSGMGLRGSPESAEHKRHVDHSAAEAWVHVGLEYHECLQDPMPVLAGECGSAGCEAGTMREWYKLVFIDSPSPRMMDFHCKIPDLLSSRDVKENAIIDWVTEQCPELPPDSYVPLANIRVRTGQQQHHDGQDDSHHECRHDDIDIHIRPVAFTGALLYNMFLDQVEGWRKRTGR